MGKRFLTYYTEDAEAGNIPVDGNGVMQPSLIPVPSDTLTWDGNTEGLTMADNGSIAFYRISGLVPSTDDMANGAIVHAEGLPGKDTQIVEMNGMLMAAVESDNGSAIAVIINKDMVGVVLEGALAFPKPGIYFTSNVRALTINGYTGFVGKTLNPAWGISKAEAVADAAGSTPTAEEFNALLTSLRNAGYLKV